MADLQRGFVPIKLDRERILRFTLKETWMLVQNYGDDFLSALYEKAPGKVFGVQLKDPDALVGYLTIGLTWDAEQHGETLTREDVELMVTPMNFKRVFTALVVALSGTHATTPPPGNGNAGGAKAEPAGATPKQAASISPTRKGLPSRTSASRRKRSGH